MWFLIVTLFPNTGPLDVLTGHVVALIVYTGIFFRFRVRIVEYIKPLLIGCFLFSATIYLSLLVNQGQAGANIGLIRYGFVPLYWYFGLIAGIIDYHIFGRNSKDLFLYRVAQLFICFQLPLIILQLIGADSIISIFWSVEKARDWTQYIRVVGTLANPNTLGIFIVLSIVIFVQNLWRKSWVPKLFIALSVIIIIATGSRTSLVLLLILPFLYITREQLWSKRTAYIIFAGLFIITISYFLLLEFRDSFPYLAQLFTLMSGGEISSLEARFDLWSKGINVFYTSSSFNQIFGLGPRFFSVMDNSYLYIILNYGIFAIITFAILVFFLFRLLSKLDHKIAIRSLAILFICGIILDSLMSFYLMTFIFYLAGLRLWDKKYKSYAYN